MMRTLLTCMLLVSATDLLFAQEAPAPSDSLFIVTYTTGPLWDKSKPPGEQPYFRDHSDNLGSWRKEGRIKFGARYADKGIIFLSAPTLAAARKRIEGDPAVLHGLFHAEVQRLQPFYYGCVEKAP